MWGPGPCRTTDGGSVGALDDDLKLQERINELEKSCNQLQRQLASAKAKTADLVGAVFRGAKEAAVINGVPKPVPAPKKDKRKASGESVLLHLTDVHMGQVTPTFNSDVCRERVHTCVKKTIKLTDIQRADHPVRECVLLLGGDMIENTATFPHQSWEVDGSTFKQVFDAATLIQETILSLLGAFETVRVYEVPGNHGRIGRGKGQMSIDYERSTNWDLIVGRIAREQLEGQKRLDWKVPDSWYQIMEIGKYRALATHGDAIRGFGGNIPAYGILRKCNAWSTFIDDGNWSDAYMGHFHTAMTLQMAEGSRVFVTPTVSSDSPFAKEFVAATGKPAQRLHFIDPERGRVTAEYLIWLDDEKEKA